MPVCAGASNFNKKLSICLDCCPPLERSAFVFVIHNMLNTQRYQKWDASLALIPELVLLFQIKMSVKTYCKSQMFIMVIVALVFIVIVIVRILFYLSKYI